MSNRADASPVLVAENLVQEFELHGKGGDRRLRALSNVSFDIRNGETLGVVGESGSGKTTLARALLQVPRPKSGSVYLDGVDLTSLNGRRLRARRRAMQMVFQDPFGSLNPKWRVSDIVEEPLIGYRVGNRTERRDRVEEMLDRVGLPPRKFGRRRPRELSGGQCQRVAIARALVPQPRLLLCDEAVSSLDVLVQAQVLDLLQRVRSELGLSCLFISHDLAVVNLMSDRVAVMYQGQLCEIGSTRSVFERPRHPYTIALLESVRRSRSRRRTVSGIDRGTVSTERGASGCRFESRCPVAGSLCRHEEPRPRRVNDQHFVACHFAPL